MSTVSDVGKAAAKRYFLLKLGIPGLLVGGVMLLIFALLVALAAVSTAAQDTTAPAVSAGGAGGTEWDPGNIISDEVFYNANSMTLEQIQVFITTQGASCSGSGCLKNLSLSTAWQPADAYCQAYPGGAFQSAAKMLYDFSRACGINPQVMLTTLQKESQGLTKPSSSNFAAAWGWHCPDTGPGGSANCNPAYAGFFNQGYGMAKQWARYKQDIPKGKYNYGIGTYNILWNVAETGCGGGPVTITNIATASLYVYTPYQPNAAAMAAYPGEGDRCSAYGNRNFYRMFQNYFGSTGGGRAATASPAAAGRAVMANGVDVTLPQAAGLTGVIHAPTPQVATAISAGLSQLGITYSWGGGTTQGPSRGIRDGGTADRHGDYNKTGYDCAGLMLYSWAQAGLSAPRNSQNQTRSGLQIPYAQRLPGDMLGWPGHVSMYIGQIDGQDYMLEAPQSGDVVKVSKVRSGHYANVARIWSGS
jgi:cell wall-associated NlpC family hydrolase